MPRRGDNIYKRKDGRWEGRIQKEAVIPGKRCYVSVYGKTYKEAKRKMELARGGQAQGTRGRKGAPRLAEAAAAWLEDQAPYWKPTTYETYRRVLARHVLPALGDVRADRISSRVLEGFARTLRGRHGGRLSADYLSYICAVVIRVLGHAARGHGHGAPLPANPVARGRKGSAVPPGEQALSVLEGHLVAGSREGSGMSLGILVAFCTGIRIGELCALTWADIDLEGGVIHVRGNVQRVRAPGGGRTRTAIQAPKTAGSVRPVPVPPLLLSLLRRNRGEGHQHVVRGTRNPWADPRTVQYQFRKALGRCGLEPFNFHMLRHAFASRCIAEGFDVKSLSEILGHSDVRLTMGLYVHPSMRQKKRLMGRFGSYLYRQ